MCGVLHKGDYAVIFSVLVKLNSNVYHIHIVGYSLLYRPRYIIGLSYHIVSCRDRR